MGEKLCLDLKEKSGMGGFLQIYILNMLQITEYLLHASLVPDRFIC